jgi:hypothetical protein
VASDLLTPETRNENATTLAAALGLSVDSAAQVLELDVLVTVDRADRIACLIGDEVCGMLSRTVRCASRTPMGTEVACELVIGAADARAFGTHVYLDVAASAAIASCSRASTTACAPIPGIYALLTACYASAATLYHATGGILPFELPEPLVISFSELGIDSAALGQEVDLGHAYLAGAGAIGNGFLWAARYLNFRGRLEIVDDDCVTSGNLNRQMWFGPADVTHPKADRLAAGAQPLVPNLLLVPRRARLQDLPEKSPKPWLRQLIVAVDSRRARRELQNEFPGEVFDASTTDIREVVLHHHLQPTESACMSCIYEPDAEEFSREHHIAEHLGVSVDEVRSERISAAAATRIAERFPNIAPAAIEGTAYDSLFKRLCSEGQLGTTADRRVVAPFAFVSVLAGTLLALELVRRLGEGASARAFNYWRVSPWHSPLGRRRVLRAPQPGCAFCGDPIRRKVTELLWPCPDAPLRLSIDIPD